MGRNGTITDQARDYAERILERLSEISDRLEYREEREEMRIVRAFKMADAVTTVISDQTLAVAGSSWLIERLTVVATPAANSQVELYLDEIQPQNLITNLAVNATTGMATQAPANGIYVPGGTIIIVRFINQVVGTAAAVNLQVRQRTAGTK